MVWQATDSGGLPRPSGDRGGVWWRHRARPTSARSTDGLPRPLSACRYHSLYVAQPLPDELLAIAHCDAGEIMAVQHRSHATFGVQFHPESFRSPDGERLLQNFLQEIA